MLSLGENSYLRVFLATYGHMEPGPAADDQHLGLVTGRAAGSSASARVSSSATLRPSAGSGRAADAASAAQAASASGSIGVSPLPLSASMWPAQRTSHHSCSSGTLGSAPANSRRRVAFADGLESSWLARLRSGSLREMAIAGGPDFVLYSTLLPPQWPELRSLTVRCEDNTSSGI